MRDTWLQLAGYVIPLIVAAFIPWAELSNGMRATAIFGLCVFPIAWMFGPIEWFRRK